MYLFCVCVYFFAFQGKVPHNSAHTLENGFVNGLRLSEIFLFVHLLAAWYILLECNFRCDKKNKKKI